eukprot:jgi/Mesvir1/22648/Mv14083-RA.1
MQPRRAGGASVMTRIQIIQLLLLSVSLVTDMKAQRTILCTMVPIVKDICLLFSAMEPSGTYCAKFDIRDRSEASRSFYVLSTWDSDNYEFKVTDGDDAWAFAVPPDEVQQLAAQHALDVGTYLELTKAAWHCKQATSRVREYAYEVEGGGALKLTWKMLVSEQEKDPEVFELVLDKGPSRLKHEIMTFLVDHASKIQDAVCNLQRAKGLMEEEVARTRDRMAAVKRDKETLERDLYAKFTQVLNAKKAKIRELKQRAGKASDSDSEGTDGDERVKEEDDSQDSTGG